MRMDACVGFIGVEQLLLRPIAEIPEEETYREAVLMYGRVVHGSW